jgi:hypothetical protein
MEVTTIARCARAGLRPAVELRVIATPATKPLAAAGERP